MYVIESVTLKYLLHLDHLRIYRPPIYKSLCPVSWLRPRVSRLFSCLLQREIRVFTYHACRSAVNPGWARWAPAHYKNTKKGHSWPGGPRSGALKGKDHGGRTPFIAHLLRLPRRRPALDPTAVRYGARRIVVYNWRRRHVGLSISFPAGVLNRSQQAAAGPRSDMIIACAV
jgi:hypothetical protein